MAASEFGEKLIPFCESQGLAAVRRLRHVENHFKAHEQAAVDRWISVKESELRDESSRKALLISKIAITLSAIAIMLSVKDQVILWFSK